MNLSQKTRHYHTQFGSCGASLLWNEPLGSAAHKKDGVPIASRGHSRGHTALKGPFCCTQFHMECVSGIVCNTGLCISVSLSHTRVGKCPVTPSGPLYQLLLSPSAGVWGDDTASGYLHSAGGTEISPPGWCLQRPAGAASVRTCRNPALGLGGLWCCWLTECSFPLPSVPCTHHWW